MNIYLTIIVTMILVEYCITLVTEMLNMRAVKLHVPGEFEGFYDPSKYKKSQQYLKENTCFSLMKTTFFVLVTLFVIFYGGFNLVDVWARHFHLYSILTALIFIGTLFIFMTLLGIPFSMYHVFILEAKYGFNKTTPRTFILDTIKTLLLTIIIGGVAFSLVVWFFTIAGKYAWIYSWIALTLLELFLVFIAPVFIMPLFNKFIPLEDGELKDSIARYAQSQDFVLKGIFKIDASRRSSKTNAFFTGFGRFRRIALFDTLISKHTTAELVSILAHEVGHYKKKHILKSLVISIVTTGFMFFVLSFFINNGGLFDAFRMTHRSIYASIVFFGFLYSPLNFLLAIIGNSISRNHEYEADRFAIETYKHPHDFILALKKLTVDNLSNLTPHPLKVFFDYSHPPVLKRIEAMKR